MSTIVYCCPFVPAEWIAAHGLRPCRVIPEERVGGVEVYAGICPFARAFAGSALALFSEHQFLGESGGQDAHPPRRGGQDARPPDQPAGAVGGRAFCPPHGPKRETPGPENTLARGDAVAIVVTTACDQMRRIADLLAERSPRPVFLMNVPATWQTPAARELYASELRRLGRFLISVGGRPPSERELARVMLEHEADRARECALQTGHRSPILENVGLARAAEGQGIPLALVGGPLLREDVVLFELVERAGGRVVLDGTETGERTRPAPFDRSRLDADPFAELVRAYFETIPDPFRRPDTLLHEWLRRETASRGVRGVILHRYVWCDNWHAQTQRLKETLGLPVLDLDAGTGGSGRTRSAARIEAFVEMLAMT